DPWLPAPDDLVYSAQHLADFIVHDANHYHNAANQIYANQKTGWEGSLKRPQDYDPKKLWKFRDVTHWIHRSILLEYTQVDAALRLTNARIVIGYVGGAGH